MDIYTNQPTKQSDFVIDGKKQSNLEVGRMLTRLSRAEAENAKLKASLAELEAAADALVNDVWGSLVSLATVRKSRLYESEGNDEYW